MSYLLNSSLWHIITEYKAVTLLHVLGEAKLGAPPKRWKGVSPQWEKGKHLLQKSGKGKIVIDPKWLLTLTYYPSISLITSKKGKNCYKIED